MKIRFLACAFFFCLNFSLAAVPSLPLAEQKQALRELAVQIKMSVDRMDRGQSDVSGTLPSLERRLAELRGFAEEDGADTGLAAKYRAVAMLVGQLKYRVQHTASSPAQATIPTRARLDLETVTASHGATCQTALGISENLPVRFSLAGAGDAWLRFEPTAAGGFRFWTDSSGMDPAIEIVHGCAGNARSLASNDDHFGLDAAVTVNAPDRSTLYAHVTNSGNAGMTTISVQTANNTISGKITDSANGQPIGGASVNLYDTSGNYAYIYASTGQDGTYTMSAPDGTYYVRAMQSQYLIELYPNAKCRLGSYYPYGLSNCELADAQTVSVNGGATAANIDIALSKGQRIFGTVRDNANQPVDSASVILYDAMGSSLYTLNADSFGRYTFTTLPPDTYKLAAHANGYGAQMYSHVACGGSLQSQCDLNQATSVAISNQDLIGADFALPVLASIQGTVSLSGPQAYPYQEQIVILDKYGNAVKQANPDSNGHFRAGPLAVGDYYAYASAPGYFSQIYNGIDCGQDCSSSTSAATIISITQTGQIGIANFSLTTVPTLRGHVQDASTGAPLSGVSIFTTIMPPAQFNSVSTTTTDVNGNYALEGTPAGQYYVWAVGSNHIDQVYSGIPCEANSTYFFLRADCDVTGAMLLNIAPGQTPGPFDFALQPSSGISGHVTVRAGGGSDLPASAQIFVYDGAGNTIAGANTDALGNYLVHDLAPGKYFVSAGNSYSNQFVTQVWQGIDCPNSCAATTGTPIVLGQSAVIGGIDFSLVRRDAVTGRVTNMSGSPISGALVDAFDATALTFVATAPTDAQGYYVLPLYLGNSYFLATEAGNGYTDQIYSGVSCPQGPAYFGKCPFTNATAIVLGYSGSQPHVANFILQDRIFASGFE